MTRTLAIGFAAILSLAAQSAAADNWVKVAKAEPKLLQTLTELVKKQHKAVKDPRVTAAYTSDDEACPEEEMCGISAEGICFCVQPDDGDCPGVTKPAGDGKWCPAPLAVLGVSGPGIDGVLTVQMP